MIALSLAILLLSLSIRVDAWNVDHSYKTRLPSVNSSLQGAMGAIRKRFSNSLSKASPTSLTALARDVAIPEERSNSFQLFLKKHVEIATLLSLSLISGLISSKIIYHSKKFMFQLYDQRSKVPVTLFPAIGGLIMSIVLAWRPDVKEGPSFMFRHQADPSEVSKPKSESISYSEITDKAYQRSLFKQLLRFLLVIIGVGTGNALGLAGPAAEAGVTITSTLYSMYIHLMKKVAPSNWKILSVSSYNVNTLLLCGSAAGFAANFDMPIVGAAYSLEITSRLISGEENRVSSHSDQGPTFRKLAVILAAISSVMYIRRGCLSSATVHALSKYPFMHYYGCGSTSTQLKCNMYIALMGAMAGVLGVVFNKFWSLESSTRKFLNRNKALTAVAPLMAAGITASSIGIIGESQCLTESFKYLENILSGNSAVSLHSAVKYLTMKYCSVGMSVASGVMGGLASPSLLIGAALGHVSSFFIKCGSPSIYILAAAAAMFSSIFRAPFTAILLVLEMSKSMEIAPVVLVAVLSSALTTVILENIHDHIFHRKPKP